MQANLVINALSFEFLIGKMLASRTVNFQKYNRNKNQRYALPII